jgi:hypothetical protein
MRLSIISLLLLVWLDGQAFAHPASGIVVDVEGQVFFLDTGEPGGFSGFIWKIDRQGRLTAVHDSGGHFLTLDAKNRFAGSDLMGWFRNKRTQWLLRTPVPGSTSALIQADGSPIVMGPDGDSITPAPNSSSAPESSKSRGSRPTGHCARRRRRCPPWQKDWAASAAWPWVMTAAFTSRTRMPFKR